MPETDFDLTNQNRKKVVHNLKITDEEINAVRKIFDRNFRPFSEDNGHLFKDFGHPKRKVPIALEKLGRAVDIVCQERGDLICHALLRYMNNSKKQQYDTSTHLLNEGVLSLSQTVEQKEKVVIELLTYYRLYKVLGDARQIFESPEIAS